MAAERNKKIARSKSASRFSEVPKANIPRSSFDRSHGHKTTFNSGYLYPILVDEALPGDTFNCNLTAIARLATPIVPFMDNLYMDTQFFAIPLRLLWDNWEKFNGEQVNPGDSTDYLIPTMTETVAEESLSDYMGLPIGVTIEHSALFHRAYNLCWQTWYKDQNLIDAPVLNTGDGPDDPADYPLRRRGKRHDYFTSCLPFPQKGPAIDIPLGQTAPVAITPQVGNFPTFVGGANQNVILGAWDGSGATTDPANGVLASGTWGTSSTNLTWDDPGLNGVADLSSATAATINQLRQAFQIQRMLERDARGGTRYTEIIKAHFGVTSPDARLQRPEYLGGGSTPIYINPVAQTSQTDPTGQDASPQGNLAATGTAMVDRHGFTKSFTEHCIIIGLVSVRADLTYQEGMNRMWSRQTRYDFYWPALNALGEQPVYNKEIFAQGTEEDDGVFGYQERYAEYRYKPSVITGKLRSNATTPLDYWHLAQDFGNLPVLGQEFIEENPPVQRVIAVQDEPEFVFDGYFKMRCARPMPLYGVPGLIDHF